MKIIIILLIALLLLCLCLIGALVYLVAVLTEKINKML